MIRLKARFGIAGWLAAILGVVAVGPAARAANSTSSEVHSGIRIERTSIPMPDGVRLAATLFLPANAKAGDKFPAILEYLPYRKDDWAAARDFSLHSYFVSHGYVSARVDIRGTGASEGAPPEREYSQTEQRDGEEVIAWLARQPWSNGNVGMMGISWGGFNSIQMATRRPPALKAIIAVDATELLFHDDVHYMDGIMHADEFELAMDQELAMSRAPDFPLDEATLKQRFDLSPWFLLYLHQQRNGAFWREPLRQPVYDSIQIPVYLIGGFYDGYRDNIPHFLSRLKSPVKALLGPWNHTYPNDAVPGPALEWRESAVRWWDRWLKGIQNGIENEPKLVVYMRHWYAPDPSVPEIPGEWRSESAWPPPEMKEQTLYLDSEHLLRKDVPAAGTHELKYRPSAGVEAGFWWGEVTNDQRPSDAFSLVYDSPPLEQETAVLGLPQVKFEASATAPLADWFARLSDVAPDGTTTLLTGAGLNGDQRESDEEPKDLEPGRFYPLEIDMHVTSWVFPRGHRIRLAISNSLWPMIWPTPYPMTTTVKLGGEHPAQLILPIVPVTAPPGPIFPKPQADPELPGYESHGDTWPGTFSVERDEIRHISRVYWKGDSLSTFPWGSEKAHEQLTYEVADDHSEASSARGEATTDIETPQFHILYSSAFELHSDSKNFYYHYERELRRNGNLIRKKSWNDTIPRDHQ